MDLDPKKHKKSRMLNYASECIVSWVCELIGFCKALNSVYK